MTKKETQCKPYRWSRGFKSIFQSWIRVNLYLRKFKSLWSILETSFESSNQVKRYPYLRYILCACTSPIEKPQFSCFPMSSAQLCQVIGIRLYTKKRTSIQIVQNTQNLGTIRRGIAICVAPTRFATNHTFWKMAYALT